MALDENRFRAVVIEALQIKPEKYQTNLRIGDIEEWDSVAHLDLISAIEIAFNLHLSSDEIVELTGLEEIRARLQRTR